jgi:hypothetical protein
MRNEKNFFSRHMCSCVCVKSKVGNLGADRMMMMMKGSMG